jgi:hypothetical protein
MTNKEDLIEKAAQRNVGDVHSNGKWVWTEYKPGKFDWRPINNKTQQSKSSNNSSNQTHLKSIAQQKSNVGSKVGKPMNIQQLEVWATKTSEDNLLKVVNGTKNSARMRFIAYNELEKRGFDVSEIDTSGTLDQLIKMTGKINTKANDDADTGNDDDNDDTKGMDVIADTDTVADIDINGDKTIDNKITEKWYLNPNDSRIKKKFNNLSDREDRIKYDKFVYKMKKKEKNYLSPMEVVQDLNEDYLEFLSNDEQRFMISAGGAGIGKSFGFNKIAELLNLKPFTTNDKPGDEDYSIFEAPDVNSGKQLLNILKAHNGKIIVFDDNDKVLRRSDCASVMKKATSPNGERIVGDPDDIKQNFEFTGRIVIMTNKDLATLAKDEDTKAIISRAMMVSEVYLTVDETIEVLENRYQDFEFKQAPRLEDPKEDEEEREEILQLIKENKDNIDPAKFTTRSFQEMIIAKRKITNANEKRKNPLFASLIGDKQKNWRDKAIAVLTKAFDSDFEVSDEFSKELIKAENMLLDETYSSKLEKAEDLLFEKGENKHLFPEKEKKALSNKKEAMSNTWKAKNNDFFDDMTLEKAEMLLLGEE